ncbi:unnamed protein product [Rotaria sp. Silwood2]|nr:unnamed protein product [Rotaria sp. Silwood2]CAF4372263.1 unnamed protein product [Rotaria sp. Silwood2]
MLTSTKIQSTNIKSSSDRKGRKAILPIPHKPKNEQNVLVMDTKKDSHKIEQSIELKDNRSKSCDNDIFYVHQNRDESTVHDSKVLVDTNSKDLIEKSLVHGNLCRRDNSNKVDELDHNSDKRERHEKISPLTYSKKNSNIDDNSENNSQSEDEKNDENFDEFILGNFIPFTGKQNVLQWLDETETKFNRFRIVRNLRYVAIPLLVEGDARYKYMRHRREIRTFDDFYEFLLLQYDVQTLSSNSSSSTQAVDNKSSAACTSCQAKSVTESHPSVTDNSNGSNVMRQSSVLASNATANVEAINSIGEQSAIKSTVVSDTSVNSESDQTLSDLRKAIVGDLIKNPKTFKGNKDDVNKWIEDIEHLFNIAHIPDSIRLDLISYSLRGDALEWFKTNRSAFVSWKTFVGEIKRAFTSSFQGELAFKKLESYTQGENQSIRSFFNEVLKLCKEADPTMSETTKLKTLLNKTKPNIQFEVRKKKPTSTTVFLEYAKEAEELLQLSNIDTSNSTSDDHNTKPVQQVSPPVTVPSFPLHHSFENAVNNNVNRYTRYPNNDYRFSNTRGNYYRPNVPYQYSQFTRNPPQNNRNFSRSNQHPGFNHTNTGRKPFPSAQANAKPDHYARKSTVNAIDLPPSSNNFEPLQEPYSSNTCSQCHQIGHGASACSNF